MKHTHAGSAVLIVLLLTAGVVLYITTVYRTTLLYTDVVLHYRQAQVQRWYATGVLNWGIAVAQTDFQRLQEQLAVYEQLKAEVQLSDKQPKEQTGALVITKIDNTTVALTAHAQCGEAQCRISCLVVYQQREGHKPHVAVRNWNIGE